MHTLWLVNSRFLGCSRLFIFSGGSLQNNASMYTRDTLRDTCIYNTKLHILSSVTSQFWRRVCALKNSISQYTRDTLRDTCICNTKLHIVSSVNSRFLRCLNKNISICKRDISRGTCIHNTKIHIMSSVNSRFLRYIWALMSLDSALKYLYILRDILWPLNTTYLHVLGDVLMDICISIHIYTPYYQ